MSVVMHIGTYKTGTSSIQAFLRDVNHTLLAGRNMRFPRGWLRRDNHLELHLAIMRPDRYSTPRSRSAEWQDPTFRTGLIRQVRTDLRDHPDELTILSAEDTCLLRYRDELEWLRRIIGEDAEIVIVLRDPGEYRASLRDQLWKWGIPPTWDVDSFAYLEPDSWLFDYDALVKRWSHYFERVTVIDYDQAVERDTTIIPAFMANLGFDRAAIAGHDVTSYWLNVRGQREPRVDGNRWTGDGPFGVDPYTDTEEAACSSD